jgi:predicted TIM-barrel fold metal-dependent hydrolase
MNYNHVADKKVQNSNSKLLRYSFTLLLSLLILSTACKTATHSDLPPLLIPPTDLSKNIDDFPVLKAFPVVDIHSHTFNARYLPLVNIALARRYDKVPLGLGYLLPDPLVVALAELIVSGSRLADTNALQSEPDLKDSAEVRATAILEGPSETRVRIAAALSMPKVQAEALLEKARNLSEADLKRADRTVQRLFGDNDPKGADFSMQRRRDGNIPNWSPYRFIYFLQRDEIALRKDLTISEFPNVDLFVHHMMDLAPVYGQHPDGHELLDFPTDQVERMRHFDRISDGKFIHFVAFSPYRARTDHGIDFEEAWRPVQDALNRGAWGVKFYPPSGYRATGNHIPFRCWLVPTLRRQWEARYQGFSNKELDGLMLKFFERCVQRDIPIFSHAGYGEFQAAAGYGPKNANPEFWNRLLMQHPHLGKLRLCLGHAGGENYWYSEGKYRQWGKDVVDLCLRYPNIYCEFGASDGITRGEDPSNQLIFANRLLEIIEKKAEFGYKIIYGSDWFMPMDIQPRTSFFNAYRQVFLTDALIKYYKEFFCRNAIRFLKIEHERVDLNPLLTQKGKDHLHEILQRAAK